MNDRQRTSRERLRLIVAQAPKHEPLAQPEPDGGMDLRGVPSVPLRVGRHVAAWIIWHTARVSLLSDAPAPREFDRAAGHSV
jgi:hypothetical protein